MYLMYLNLRYILRYKKGIWDSKQKGMENDKELTLNNLPQFEVHLNYVPHVPHFVVQVWYKIGDLGLETKGRREGFRACSELCTTNCGTFKLCTTCTTFCGTSVVQNRGFGS